MRPGRGWSALGTSIVVVAGVLGRIEFINRDPTDPAWPWLAWFVAIGVGGYLAFAPEWAWWPWTPSRIASMRANHLLPPLDRLREEGLDLRNGDQDEAWRRLPGWTREVWWELQGDGHPAAERFAMSETSVNEHAITSEYDRLIAELDDVRAQLTDGTLF